MTNKQIVATLFGAIVLVGAIAAGVVVVVGHNNADGPKQALTMAVYRGEISLLPYIAQEQGFFAKHGLAVQLKEFTAGKLAFDELLADKADMAICGEFVFVSNSFNGTKSKIIASAATQDINRLVARKDHGIQSPTDLKGKIIGTTRKSQSEFYLGQYLLYYGLTLEDITIIDLTPDEIVKKLTSGEVDAGATWDPLAYEIGLALGDKVAIWPLQAEQKNYFILAARNELLDAGADDRATKVLRALIDADEFVKKYPQQAKAFAVKRFNLNDAYIDYIWPKVDLTVGLEQALLLAMEHEARWRMKQKLTESSEMPNFLDLIDYHSLEAVGPGRVMIIH